MEELTECDTNSEEKYFHEPVRRKVEAFSNNTDDIISIGSSVVSSLPISTINCKDDEVILSLQNALELNEQTAAKYKQLEEIMYKVLLDIRKKMKENSEEFRSHKKAAAKCHLTYIRCGKPYFRDKNNLVAPDNPDTMAMRQAEMYDFSQQTKSLGWTTADKAHLVDIVTKLSWDIRKTDLNTQIDQLKKENSPGHTLEIDKIEKQIHALKYKALKDIVLPLDEEYDWEYVSNKLKLKHTAQECKSIWKLLLHPSINKGIWSKAEHNKLQMIASQMKMQNWDLISKYLGTGRTAYQCFIYCRSNITNKSLNCKWTDEETKKLHRVIEYFRQGPYIPWGKVTSAMDNRTKAQVYNKYARMGVTRKGRFIAEEDVVILICYEKYGLDFKKMAHFLPGRSIVQIRTRFNILTRYRVSTTWTIADDRKLLQIMANQDTNSSFSTATAYFPGKDRMHIRSRYLTLKKWIKSNPATDIALAPRRGARRLVQGYADIPLDEAITNLKKILQTDVPKKKSGKLTRDSSERNIENAILAVLVNEMNNDESYRTQPLNETDKEKVLDKAANIINVTNLKRILILLNASLCEDKLKSSKYGDIFKLLSKDAENSDVKVKSYSKNVMIKTIQMNKTPEFSGNTTINPTKYVLPPNFSTLTGCRVLLNSVSHRSENTSTDDINLSLMAQRNPVFHEALTKLKNRFKTLFLWPLLLSNEQPPNIVSQEISSHHVEPCKLPLPQAPDATIPIYKKLEDLKNKLGDIDLSTSNSSNEVNMENPVDTPGCSYEICFDSD